MDKLEAHLRRMGELIVLRSDPMPDAGMHEPTITRVELHDHGDKTG
jgi:hypothetical protein